MSSQNVAVSGDKQDQGKPFLPRALATPAGTGQSDVTIDMLHDDVLLEIFDSYRKLVVEPDRMWRWEKLLHVCRRWRYLVLASPRRLDLQIKCDRTAPTRRLLDIWPALPIFISCCPWKNDLGSHNIFPALQRRDRISQMHFTNIPWKDMKLFVRAMGGPFPVLTHLCLHVYSLAAILGYNDLPAVTAVLPDSLLGGSAPRLQSFILGGIAFPAFTNLVLSATHFRQLHLLDIPHAGYIPPEAMVTFLLPLHNLKHLTIGFSSPESRPLQLSPPPSTHALLPSLTSFRFDGASEYLVDFIARIDAPMLNKFHVMLSSDVIPNISQLHKFIDRIDRPKTFTQAKVVIRRSNVGAIFKSRANLELDISCKTSNSPLLSMWRLYDQLLTIPSQVEKLVLCEKYLDKSVDALGMFIEDGWECDQDDPLWLELLIPFVSVKRLYVSEGLGLYIASALGKLHGESVAEVLPALDNLFLEIFESSSFVKKTIKSFVTMRQLSGHPVILRAWNRS